MTIMGLNYLNYQENQRHNLQTEGLGMLGYQESVRTDLANEAIKSGNLDETIRSDKARETISLLTLGEENRSNRAREKENLRSNLAREIENHRNNVAQVDLAKYKTDMDILSSIAPITALGQSSNFGTIDGLTRVSLTSEALGNSLLGLLGPLGRLSKPTSGAIFGS